MQQRTFTVQEMYRIQFNFIILQRQNENYEILLFNCQIWRDDNISQTRKSQKLRSMQDQYKSTANSYGRINSQINYGDLSHNRSKNKQKNIYKLYPKNITEFEPVIGVINSSWKSKKSTFVLCRNFGTAFAISNNIIITCTHNIYVSRYSYASDVQFVPGIKIGEKAGQNKKIYKAAIFKKQDLKYIHFQIEPTKEELTLLILQQPIYTEIQPYVFPKIGYLQKHLKYSPVDLTILGYPAQDAHKYKFDQFNKFQISKLEGRLCSIQDYKIHYQNKTVVGISGSPVFARNKRGEPFIIGMHTHSGRGSPTNPLKKPDYNSGLYFNEEIIQNIKAIQYQICQKSKSRQLKFLIKPFIKIQQHNDQNYSQQIDKLERTELAQSQQQVKVNQQQKPHLQNMYKKHILQQQELLSQFQLQKQKEIQIKRQSINQISYKKKDVFKQPIKKQEIIQIKRQNEGGQKALQYPQQKQLFQIKLKQVQKKESQKQKIEEKDKQVIQQPYKVQPYKVQQICQPKKIPMLHEKQQQDCDQQQKSQNSIIENDLLSNNQSNHSKISISIYQDMLLDDQYIYLNQSDKSSQPQTIPPNLQSQYQKQCGKYSYQKQQLFDDTYNKHCHII